MSQELKNHEEQEQTSVSRRDDPDGFLAFDVHTLAQIHEDRSFVQVLFEHGTTHLMLFAFKAGQRLQDHRTSRQVLIQVVRGQITFTRTDTSVTLHEGRVLHIEANTFQRSRVDGCRDAVDNDAQFSSIILPSL